MDFVDRIDPDEKVDKLTKKEEEEKDNYFLQMLRGKDPTEIIKTKRGDFKVRFPRSSDVMAIGRLMTFRRGGVSPQAYDSVTERLNLTVSTLDVIVVSGPDWYEEAKRKDEKFTFMEVPDGRFVEELYQKAYSFCEEMRKILEETEGTTDTRIFTEENNADALGSGSSEEVSGKQGNTKT